MKNLIGKYFELLAIDNSVIHRFEIKHVKDETLDSINHEDESATPIRNFTYVSENGSSWFRIYGGVQDRIVD